MRVPQLVFAFVTSALSLMAPQHAASQNVAAQGPPYGRPDATIDLRTKEGKELVKGVWRYSDVKIVETDFRAPGPDLKPSGKPSKTYDYTPHASWCTPEPHVSQYFPENARIVNIATESQLNRRFVASDGLP